MFCSHCGQEISDEAVICPHCGCETVRKKAEDGKSIGFAILSFFIPLVGLILYLIWKDEKPLRAKSAGKGALIGVIVSVAASILSGIVYSAFIGGMFTLM